MSFKNYPARGGTVRHLSSFPQYQSLAETYGCSAVHKSFLSDYFARCSSLYHLDLLGHYGCVNAIEFSNNGGEFIVSGGDDRRVVVWNIEKCVYGTQPPVSMKGEHKSNIFCTVFDNDNRHIFSAGNDNQALRHDFTTGETVGMYYHDDPVYGLNIHPEDNNVFLTASDDGKVMLWDIRASPVSGSSTCIARHESAFHAAVFNPVDPSLIATANSKKGVQLWDVRVPISCLRQFSYGAPQMCAMGLKWNRTGDMITALRRRLPPVLYHVTRSSAVAEFHHPGYNNVCTMKSNCFAGSKDQFVVSGSDDFNIYIWEVPDDWADHDKVLTVGRAFMVLHGHRSIVNQVRFNPETHMLLSAGVEKVIKVWSPFPVPRGCSEMDTSHKSRRELYSHSDYLSFIQFGGLPLNHDEYESKSTAEDPRMLAFFDSLIQREKDNLHSDSEDSLLDDFHLSFILQPDSSEESDSDTTETSMSHLLLRELLHRPSSETLEGRAAINSSGQGVLRRLRKLRDTVVIRDLLNAGSSSTDSEEGNHVKVVGPALPSDLESGEGTTQSTVQFKRHKPHKKRQYRSRNRSRDVDDTSSSESADESDYTKQKIQIRADKDNSIETSSSSNSSSSGSSSHSERDSRKSKGYRENTESSSDDAEICKLSHKRRKLNRANSKNLSNNLKTQGNVCKATEVNTNGTIENYQQLDGNNGEDSQNANNILHGEGIINSDRCEASQTDCSSDLHVSNQTVTSHESIWADHSSYNPRGNKKSSHDQGDDHEESSR